MTPTMRGLFLYASIYFVLATVASIYSWDRVPLQYYAPIAWLLPLFVAELAGAPPVPKLRTACAVALSLAALVAVAVFVMARAASGRSCFPNAAHRCKPKDVARATT